MIYANFINIQGLQNNSENILNFNMENSINLTFTLETWLSPTASVPFRQTISNLLTLNSQVISGGRRHSGGILTFASDANIKRQCRVVYEDPHSRYVAIQIGDVTLICCYLAPSRNNSELEEILVKAEELTDDFGTRCIICGDLNARLGSYTGDHSTNTRGELLLELLENRDIDIQLPSKGKWSCFSGGGCSVPDIVLSNFQVNELTVHEHAVFSDHRPVTFGFEPNFGDSIGKDFQRWNVRRLIDDDNQRLYQKLLEQSIESPFEVIEQSSDNPTQENIDHAWEGIKKWISAAATNSIGIMVISDRVPENYWTDELVEMRESIQLSMSELQKSITDPGQPLSLQERRNRASVITNSQRNYRIAGKLRRKALFDKAVDDLGEPQNAGAFMRMIKGAQSRRSKSGCKLDPDRINEHAQYFLNTFGGEPSGTRQMYQFNEPHFNSSFFSSTDEIISATNTSVALSGLPAGKAAGPDGIPAELYSKGGPPVTQIMSAFLKVVHATARIPTEWRKATIVPIYKKKGADTDISNHRPIALTCTARRLYERLLVTDLSNLAAKTLCRTQAGFRPNRSTLDQAMVLHEAITRGENPHVVLLDLKAAYDLVDRRILWDELTHHFGLPAHAVSVLKDLFDNNVSSLLVAGRESDPIANARGLLQGSTLSPIIFNFFIDRLCRKLGEPGVPLVRVHGLDLNRLLFADDTALIARDAQAMAHLLKVCEKWSQVAGMKFAPQKCVVLGPSIASRPVPLQLYGTDLPSAEQATYLGIPFTQGGIAWKVLCKERTKKAADVIRALAPMGFNARGWAPAASARVYKTFVRPVMEYGMALSCNLPSECLQRYERTQALALRTLCSAPPNTSWNGLRRLLQIEPMAHRTKLLNLQWAARLYTSGDKGNVAVHLFHNAIRTIAPPARRSMPLPLLARQNTLWQQSELDGMPPLVLGGNGAKPKKALSNKAKLQLRCEAVAAKENPQDAGSIANTLQLEHADSVRPFLQAAGKISRDDRWLLLQWILGAVTRHEQCKNCPEPRMTRVHAAVCSGADDFLASEFPSLLPQHSRHTRIDAVLNNFRNSTGDHPAYKKCVMAIQKILTKCRGLRRRQSDGYWTADTTPDSNSSNEDNLQPMPVIAEAAAPTQASIRQSQRNAAISLRRNRPRGRPRRQPSDDLG